MIYFQAVGQAVGDISRNPTTSSDDSLLLVPERPPPREEWLLANHYLYMFETPVAKAGGTWLSYNH